ncbi:MAG: proline--tRNA ligase [Pseudomonadota bacterium]
MRTSRLNLNTLKEVPAEAEIASHQLMLRAGLIRRLASGLFTWMPVGLRVAKKVEAIVREEMDKAGALEIVMPAVQPAELWRESERWEQYGPLLLKMQDRHERDYCFGPTHEEVVTDIARRELKSYRQLPICYYQIQTKFRDEIRPRFGVMRAREFLMKDAYSFHLDQQSQEETYQAMANAYREIFTRLGLKFRAVEADGGEIGGSRSQEFHVLADSGEDALVYSDQGDYAANLEMAPTPAPSVRRPEPTADLERIATPGAKTIDALTRMLDISGAQCVKTLIVEGETGPVALVLRGDHELNAVKAQKLAGVKSPLTLATPEAVVKVTGCGPGYVGPQELDIPIIVDHAAGQLADFVCGGNEKDVHLTGVNWERDIPLSETFDIRNAVEGDPAPNGNGSLSFARGIEVGHIFQLGTKYSEAMGAVVQDKNGKEVPMAMGCYGIGVTRIVAAAIEQNHDANGIVWPGPMAPWQVAIVGINMHRSETVREAAETLYAELNALGFECLLDDRDARPGVKFADMELLGIPHRLVLGERALAAGQIEYRHRSDIESQNLDRDAVLKLLQDDALG